MLDIWDLNRKYRSEKKQGLFQAVEEENQCDETVGLEYEKYIFLEDRTDKSGFMLRELNAKSVGAVDPYPRANEIYSVGI